MDRPATARGDISRDIGISVLAVAMALSVMNMTLIVPVIPRYAEVFEVSLAAAAAMVSVFAAGRLVFRFWSGIGADRFGARRAAVTGALVVGAGAAMAATAPVFWVVLVARAVQGVGVATLGVSLTQHLIRVTPRHRLGRAMAVFQTGIVGGAAVGPLIGGALADLGDLRTPFWAQVGMSLALVPMVLAVVGRTDTRARSVRASLGHAREMVRRPVFLGVMLMGFSLFFLRAGARNALLPAFADAEVGLSATAIGAVVSASSLTSTVVMIPIGRVVDRIGRKPVALAGAVLVAGSVALYSVATSRRNLAVGIAGGVGSCRADAGSGLGAASHDDRGSGAGRKGRPRFRDVPHGRGRRLDRRAPGTGRPRRCRSLDDGIRGRRPAAVAGGSAVHQGPGDRAVLISRHLAGGG
jgi:MFS family permease